MRARTGVLVAMVAMLASASGAQQLPPREIWPQATAAARDGDVEGANKKTAELITTGRAYGLKIYPPYAGAAEAMARQAQQENKPEVAEWATKAAAQLDFRNPEVAFSAADTAASRQNWGRAIPTAMRGFTYLFSNFRTGMLSRADLLILLAATIALTAFVFAIMLFFRYGRSMAHDFREMLGRRFHGGSVSVLAFALLFLPIFLTLSPLWLIFYWFIIFFGYANKRERTFIAILLIFVAAVPIILAVAAHWIAALESPVVMAAISSSEQSYKPQALRRLQELAAVVPDNSLLHELLGNLHVFEGNEQQAAHHYRRAIELNDSAGAHVNLGNLHFLQNDYAAAITEYSAAEKLDPKMAIAFYNDSVANGETYRFDQQGQKLEQAKKIDRSAIESLSQNPPAQKIAMYHPPMRDAWRVASEVARGGTARSLLGNYSYLDLKNAALNPLTIGAVSSLLLALALWSRRKRRGYAGSCIKCGRTFCHRCKSARESATYCTQCIHIYLKRDGVALATKRAKLDEVSDHHAGVQRRNRLFATFIPGSAQVLEGRTLLGVMGMFLFFLFLSTALCVGRLAPAIGPVAESAHLMVRVVAIALTVLVWLFMSFPVYRRRATV
jgi:tetratricopeptide (TPR) repeat protein